MVDMPPRARFPSYYPRFPLFAGSVRLVVNRGLWRQNAQQPNRIKTRFVTPPNPNRAKPAKTNTAPRPDSIRCGLNAVQLKRGSGAIYLNAVQTRFVTPQNPNRARPAKTDTAPRPDSVRCGSNAV